MHKLVPNRQKVIQRCGPALIASLGLVGLAAAPGAPAGAGRSAATSTPPPRVSSAPTRPQRPPAILRTDAHPDGTPLTVAELAANVGATFTVTRSAPADASGIHYYDVHSRFDEGAWLLWQNRTLVTSAMLDGSYGIVPRAWFPVIFT